MASGSDPFWHGMTQDPILRPDFSKTKPPSREEERTATFGVHPGNRTELTQMARTLAAHGGGAVAFDLALDLVLNDMVEQARVLTGATGAAIALARNGQMECRATTGVDAPGLGVRVETESGLSGACLQTADVQVCSDTETDPRVDSKACRELGIRSMLIIPLDDGRGPFGILEVQSSEAGAFDERDVLALRALARKIVANKFEAERGVARGAELAAEPAAAAAAIEISRKPDRSFEAVRPVFAETPPPANDLWNTILALLVIAAAVALGVLVGWRGASQRATSDSRPAPAVKRPTGAVPSGTGSEQEEPTLENTLQRPAPKSAPQLKKGNTVSSADAPSGGLLVTNNGKVVYRQPGNVAPVIAESRLEASERPRNRLIRSVQPQYPAAAKARRIQGLVVLQVQVMGDGSVGSVGIVTGEPLLAEAAVHAVRQWKYQPYIVDGRPVESQTQIKINFTLAPTS